MSYTVEWTKAAKKDYDCLELVHQRVVDTCIEEMETDPFRGAKRLKHCPLAEWRKRAGPKSLAVTSCDMVLIWIPCCAIRTSISERSKYYPSTPRLFPACSYHVL
ncbi:hypothetical protein HNY73_004647 [Argiope bruennichi]|uniref:Type II toxin-antitoxin system RelE/ParE family toxin n=1 Tax=Argiope bruennichi TaxID=94029 RepID=A0A8T0FPM0_ARGBR|nr:hypothetical protein HNY73_004647 [Argiope bruennichi]